MNKIISSFLLLVTMGVNAQNTPTLLRRIPGTQIKTINNQRLSGNIIWSDDFSLSTPWIRNNDEGNSQNWKITTYPPSGQYSQQLGRIESKTPDKTAIFDADFMSDDVSKQRGKLTNANAINCKDRNTVFVKFYSYYAKWQDKVFFKVSGDGGKTWKETELYSSTPDLTITNNPEIFYINISDVAAGSENVFIQFYFDGMEQNHGIVWIIDDVEVFEPAGIDARITEFETYWYMAKGEEFKPSISIQNVGAEIITSVAFRYSINDSVSKQTVIENLQIKPFETTRISHPDSYIFSEIGKFQPSIIIESINNQNVDITTSGDYINVLEMDNKKPVVAELFTSSTCSPCAGFNPFFDKVQTLVSPGILNTVKYQMNWPENGDPYFTADGDARKKYYSVNSVPTLYLNGTYCDLNNYGTSIIKEMIKDTCYFDLSIDGSISGTEIDFNITVNSTDKFSNKKLFLSINEKQTTENIGTNGEEEFHHVMMKLLPGKYGKEISYISSEEPFVYADKYDLTKTNIEQLNDLEIIAFVQDSLTKEILGSKSLDLSWLTSNKSNFAKENKMIIYPNPARNTVIIQTDAVGLIEVNTADGRKVKAFSNEDSIRQINISDWNPGVYIIRFYSQNNEIKQSAFVKY